MDIKISRRVAAKLKDKHGVSTAEVVECFANRHGKFFTDTRQVHQTDPPTYWFVAETDRRRVLKIVFVRYPKFFAIKSAFDRKDGSAQLYEHLMERES